MASQNKTVEQELRRAEAEIEEANRRIVAYFESLKHDIRDAEARLHEVERKLEWTRL